MSELRDFNFPFLGVRENGEPFAYLLLDIDKEEANIAIFNWMVNHIHLNLEEKIDLFIPSFLTVVYQSRHHNTPGIVESIKKEEDKQTTYYRISFKQELPITFTENGAQALAKILPSGLPLKDLLIRLVKDSLILKQGILVYLKHFAQYFYRIMDYSHQNYKDLKTFIFDDIRKKVNANVEVLNKLYLDLKDIKDLNDISLVLNLEYLRENIESEINLDLFMAIFSNLDSHKELMQLLKQFKSQNKPELQYFYINYLMSIKDLEKRLYSNYNQIVLIYLKSI